MKNKVLIVASHPDDEVLGCGGAIVKFIQKGYEAFTLILGEGKTSRIHLNSTKNITEELIFIKEETIKANNILGIKKVFTCNFPDNKFDSVPLLDIVKEIEKIKKEIEPSIIFTHHYGDMNIDHQLTHKAVLTATRPMINECVQDIYSFEIPSSTEWNTYYQETVFVPNVFIDITDTIDIKLRALAEYKSELKIYPHPRSLDHVKELAKVNGTKVGLEYSENFHLIRSIRKVLL